MNEVLKNSQIEARWPVLVTIIAAIAMIVLLPERIRILPTWTFHIVVIGLLVPTSAVSLTRGGAYWERVERVTTLFFCVVLFAGIVFALVNLIDHIISGSGAISGLQLLATSIALWLTNVLLFAVFFWQVDRGGPQTRANGTADRPDWLFPEYTAPADSVPPGWGPTFVDYLYLSYSTSTAFSTTDVSALTARAKLLMMAESGFALVTIVVVGARAINILN
jgi:hypothetical protein